MKLNFPSCVTGEFLVLLNKNEIPELHNSEVLFSLKIPSNEKSAMTSQFDLTQIYDVIIRNSVF